MTPCTSNKINIDKLSNGIRIITKHNQNTPRTSINLFMASGTRYENLAGTANLASRLLLQGTETKNAEEIANAFDSNAIEVNIEAKQDYLRTRALFLNEDLGLVCDLLEDTIKNSNFKTLEKEAKKFEGEIKLDLDSPKTQALDNLISTIYASHPYGNTHTRILKDLNKIDINAVKDFYYKNSFAADKMVISVVGDICREKVLGILESKYATIPPILSGKDIKNSSPQDISALQIDESKTITASREDAAQAQIIQGWIAPDINKEDYATVVLMNLILGASGLSSRLFVELRDKKGLAYTVRSSYEALKESGVFSIYIGTAPENIKTCIEGFNTEIEKLQTISVSDKELADAKNNYMGKRAFFHETNSQQAYYLGFYQTMGLGAEFDEQIIQRVKSVTSEDIKNAANRYLSGNSVTSILAPKKYLY